jgi:hypothetical protein
MISYDSNLLLPENALTNPLTKIMNSYSNHSAFKKNHRSVRKYQFWQEGNQPKRIHNDWMMG